MTTRYFNVKQGITTGNIVIDASSGNITNVGNITLVAGTAANLGNSVSANYFTGDGYNLTNINGANVSGQVANALVAGTVYTNAQPNITSVGNLTGLTVGDGTANVRLYANGDVLASGNISASNFIGNVVGNISGNITVPGANTQVMYNANGLLGADADFTFNSATNTLSVPTANVTDLNAIGNVSGNLLTGTLTTASQPNITSVGTLSSLTVSGNIAGGNVNGGNLVTANFFSGNGSALSSITGGNVTGQVGNALVAGTVYTAAQPNITSVGTLTSLSVTGNVDAGNVNVVTGVISGQYLKGDGYQISNIAGGNVTGQVGNALVAGTVYTNAQPNITSVGTLTSLSVTGNVSAGNVSGTLLSGTLSTAAQPNVTSVGTLTGLTVGGDATVTGNFTVTGTTTYINVNSLRVEDPIIEMGGGVNGAPLTNNDGKDRGSLLHYFSGSAIDAFMGWDNSNGEFAFGSNVSVNADVVTFNELGNIRANFFIGNGSQLTGVAASTAVTAGTVTTNAQPNITSVGTLTDLTVSGNITAGNVNGGNLVTANFISGNGSALSSITGGNVTGQVGNALVAGTVYTNAQPNITSVGTLTSLDVTGTATVGNLYANAGTVGGQFLKGDGYQISNIAGGNVTGQVGNALVAGTVYSNAQPNITSVGTLTSLSVTGNVSVGGILTNNYYYANGAPVDFQQAAGNTGEIQFNSSGDFGASTGLTWNSGTSTLTATNISGNGSGLSSITGGNVTGQVGNALVAGTVYTNAQPNITSVGTLTSLDVTGNVAAGNVNGGNLVVANYFSGDGSLLGNLTGGNVTGQVGNALVAGTVYTNAQPNITSVGTLTNLNVSGNVTTGTLKLNTGITSNRSNVSVVTSAVVDSFSTTTYRTAKYIISAGSDDGYQSVEAIVVHDGSSAYVSVYGSVCSNVSADIIELSAAISGGSVELTATSPADNTIVNMVATYIKT